MCPGRWLIHNPLGLPRLPSSHAIRPFLRSTWHSLHRAVRLRRQRRAILRDQGRALARDRGARLSGLRRRPGKPLHQDQTLAGRPERMRRRAALRAGGCRRRTRRPAAGGVPALPDDPAGQPLGVDVDRAGGTAHLRRPARRAAHRRILRVPADEQCHTVVICPSTGTPTRSMYRASFWPTAAASTVKKGWRGDYRDRAFLRRCTTAPARISRRCSAPTTTATITITCTSTWRDAAPMDCGRCASNGC